jgi:hypothetical protein
MKTAMPFYSQKWELDQWQELGFESFEEAEYWERSSCGVLCLKMAIDAFLSEQGRPSSPSIDEYIRKGVEIGAYEDSTGWSHDGLVRLANEFGFFATRHGNVSAAELQKALEEGCLPIVSIRWAFERSRSLKEKILFWKKVGGHLALVIGFKGGEKLEGFFIHHTSIRPAYNWPSRYFPVAEFKRGFTGRCICIKPKEE